MIGVEVTVIFTMSRVIVFFFMKDLEILSHRPFIMSIAGLQHQLILKLVCARFLIPTVGIMCSCAVM